MMTMSIYRGSVAFRHTSRHPARGSRTSATVFESDGDVTAEARDLAPPHRASAHARPEGLVRTRRQLRRHHGVPVGPRLPGRIVRHGRRGIPRTDFLADVAAVDVVPSPASAAGASPLSSMVKCEMQRVESDTRRDDRVRRAGLDTACGALIEGGPIAVERRLQMISAKIRDRGRG